MVPPEPSAFQTWQWQFEESASEVTRAASTSVFHGFPLPSSHGSGSHCPDTSSYSVPVDQAAFNLGVQDYSATFPASGFTPQDLTQDHALRGSPLEYDLRVMLAGDPVRFYVFVRAPGSTSMIFKGGEQFFTSQRCGLRVFRVSP